MQWFKHRFFGMTSSPSTQGELVQCGFYYLEAPRFHNGYLYCSDMHNPHVHKIDPNTGVIVLSIPFNDKVSGLGWLSTGELLVVAMTSMQILKYNEETKECEVYADLTKYSNYRCNDMVVDVDDHVYVGSFGFDIDHLLGAGTTTIVNVNPDREVSLGSRDMFFPNGCVITPDGKTLIVAETMRGQLAAFDIIRSNDDGFKLANRRVWADVKVPLDGICLDAEGCVWAAIPQVGAYHTCGCVVRIAEHGVIRECFGFKCNGLSAMCIAVNLYTDESNQPWLYVIESQTIHEKKICNNWKGKNSWITKIPVAIGPARREDCTRYNAGMC